MRRPRDPRTFRSFVKLTADGAIAAVVHVADGQVPSDGHGSLYVDISAVGTAHRAPSGGTILGGNVDLEKDARVQQAMATAIAADVAANTPPPPPPPIIDPGPVINTTAGLGGGIVIGG